MARIVLHNAKVYVEKGHFEEAILIDGTRIKAVGKNDDILKIGEDAEIIDCKGKTVIPGMNDSHMHFFNYAETKNQVSITDAKSVEEIVGRGIRFAKEKPEAVASGMLASWGYDRGNFDNPEKVPTKHDLDRISTEYPIVFDSTDIYYRSVNSKVLEICGIDENTPVPEGGKIMLGEDGKPDGVLWGNAMELAASAVPSFSLDFYHKILMEAQSHALKHGLTSVQSNDIGYSMYPQQKGFDLLKDMVSKGELKMRYNSQTSFRSLEECKEFLKNGEFAKADYGEDSLITVGSLKLLRDGNLGSKTAMLKNGYADDRENKGASWHDMERVRGVCALAKKYGATVTTHAIGDQAVEEVLDIYEEFFGKENPKRSSIVHYVVSDERQNERVIENNVLVFPQPALLFSRESLMEYTGDEELVKSSQPFGTLIARGAHVAYGTDSPVIDFNPFPTLHAAIVRKVWEGAGEEADAKECVDRETALDAYTIEGAYAEFLEDRKGRIRENYYADIAVLSDDYFTCDVERIPEIESVLTIVRGEIVYRK